MLPAPKSKESAKKAWAKAVEKLKMRPTDILAVSYTHLTLPTKA